MFVSQLMLCALRLPNLEDRCERFGLQRNALLTRCPSEPVRVRYTSVERRTTPPRVDLMRSVALGRFGITARTGKLSTPKTS